MKFTFIRLKYLVLPAVILCLIFSNKISYCESSLCSRLQGAWQHVQVREGDENRKPENTHIDFITTFTFECVNEKRNIGKINIVTQIYKKNKEMSEYFSGYFVVSGKNEKELILDLFVSRDGETVSTDGNIINRPTEYSEIILTLDNSKSITVKGRVRDLHLEKVTE